MNSLLARDRQGYNCMELAIQANNIPFVKRLFECKTNQWKKLMRNAQLSQNDKYVDTPMRKLVRCMPEIAYQALDKCKMETNFPNEYDQSLCEKQFDFEFLEDHCHIKKWQSGKSRNFQKKQKKISKRNCFNCSGELHFVCDELPRGSDDDFGEPYSDDAYVLVKNHVLSIIAEQARDSDKTDDTIVKLQTKLLRHPTCQKLMNQKWHHFGVPIFATCFIAYVLYLALFTWTVLRHTDPYQFYNATGVPFSNDRACEKVAQLIRNGTYNMTQKPSWEQVPFSNVGFAWMRTG
ncbi:unnamed protein product [Rotaria sp. Silwood1]|nr:unnamed protein product [Rotaria sp. Silwood1]CAF1370174.1 unnamed protein product [Rotaria sp. Silwood1]CAF3498149.1 unnamed protein product [Rotaria sp. Silwood1]CAF4817612.1 unnamed protein product [Rotaria sp. Silwood1]